MNPWLLEKQKPSVSLLPPFSSVQAPTTAWHPSIKIEKTFRLHFIQQKTVVCSLDKNEKKEILNRGYSFMTFSGMDVRLCKQASKASFQP